MEPAKASGRPDLELVSPFIMAAVETFRVQYSLELTHRDPYQRGEQLGVARDLVATFGVFSGAASVAVSFCFPEATYQGLLKKMAGDPNRDYKDAIENGIRELVNVIFGKVKKFTSADGNGVHRSIPTMVSGTGLKVWYLSPAVPVVIPFSLPDGDFEIELTLER